PRSDLYGLAATILRIATGRPPFEGANLGELVQRILAGRTPPLLANVPRALGDLVQRMLARDADARPPTALAVLDELDQLAPAIAPRSSRRARPVVGAPPAAASWPGAGTWIDAFAGGLAGTHAALVVVGVAASGARALVDAAIGRRQLDDVVRGRATLP